MQESGTTIERDATLCEGGQLDDYITSVVKSRGRDFDVIVVGIKLEDSKKPGILSR